MPRARIRVPLKTFHQNWKVTINDIDVTSEVVNLGCESRSLRYGIGSFNIRLWNDKGKHNSTVLIGHTVKIYYEHTTSTPTNQIYDGKVDKPIPGLTGTNRWEINIVGRDFPELADDKITVSFTDSQANDAIKYIIDTYFNGIYTYTNLHSDMTGIVNGDYVDQKPITIIIDVLKQVGYDGYIDTDRDIHTFPDDGTNRNLIESISYGNNLLPFTGFGRDGLQEFNKVKVYGDSGEEISLFRTKKNTTSISETWRKTKIITARNLLTPTSVATKAQTEVNYLSETFSLGAVPVHSGLPTLKPSQYLSCSAQYVNMNDWYKAIYVRHQLLSNGRANASVTLSKPLFKTSKVLREQEDAIISSNRNPNGMTDVLVYLKFKDTEGITSLGDLEIFNGRLRLQSGKTTGTMTTDVEVADDNLTDYEIRASVNDDCNISTSEVSNNGGGSYGDKLNVVGDRDIQQTFSTTGKRIRATITLNQDTDNPAPEIESFEVLAK